ncbi:MAG: 2-amino-4-hydroxy-6-hydroxymethyldihydropteridine diphosphokinase [Alphaproteobacteria bacterium]|nr:2-amino-4-hydroxy-6-hydroxymethyldihydropteridine diphosphokinase [Alphaproteobacteria bacterium]
MILIALGANLPGRFGPPEESLREALSVLEGRRVKVVRVSSIWESAPVPLSDQPRYRNAAAQLDTVLEPLELLRLLKDVERDFGRTDSVQNAPRVLDLDLLAYREILLRDAQEDLLLPHPRLHERAFVLYPLAEIAPDWVHPVLKLSTRTLLDRLPENQDINRSLRGDIFPLNRGAS